MLRAKIWLISISFSQILAKPLEFEENSLPEIVQDALYNPNFLNWYKKTDDIFKQGNNNLIRHFLEDDNYADLDSYEKSLAQVPNYLGHTFKRKKRAAWRNPVDDVLGTTTKPKVIYVNGIPYDSEFWGNFVNYHNTLKTGPNLRSAKNKRQARSNITFVGVDKVS